MSLMHRHSIPSILPIPKPVGRWDIVNQARAAASSSTRLTGVQLGSRKTFPVSILCSAVGGAHRNDRGALFKTANGGASWQRVQTPRGDTAINGVHFIDAQTGWIVGDGGLMLKTANGGRSWERQPAPVEEALREVHFIDARIGWIVGSGRIFKTTDGGRQWNEQVPQQFVFNHSLDVHFIDAEIGWLATAETILKTTDGGSTWSRLPFKGRITSVLFKFGSIYFLDAYTGWVVAAEEGIFKTTDGGQSWERQQVPNELLLASLSSNIHFLNTGIGWAAGP